MAGVAVSFGTLTLRWPEITEETRKARVGFHPSPAHILFSEAIAAKKVMRFDGMYARMLLGACGMPNRYYSLLPHYNATISLYSASTWRRGTESARPQFPQRPVNQRFSARFTQ